MIVNVMKTSKRSASKADDTRFVRRTITLPPEVAGEISALVGERQFSGFVQHALQNELQRERLAAWLDERVAARKGEPLAESAKAFARNSWRKRK